LISYLKSLSSEKSSIQALNLNSPPSQSTLDESNDNAIENQIWGLELRSSFHWKSFIAISMFLVLHLSLYVHKGLVAAILNAEHKMLQELIEYCNNKNTQHSENSITWVRSFLSPADAKVVVFNRSFHPISIGGLFMIILTAFYFKTALLKLHKQSLILTILVMFILIFLGYWFPMATTIIGWITGICFGFNITILRDFDAQMPPSLRYSSYEALSTASTLDRCKIWPDETEDETKEETEEETTEETEEENQCEKNKLDWFDIVEGLKDFGYSVSFVIPIFLLFQFIIFTKTVFEPLSSINPRLALEWLGVLQPGYLLWTARVVLITTLALCFWDVQRSKQTSLVTLCTVILLWGVLFRSFLW
jgi:hypothetical protein